jgi:membrane-bound metal-dependent hydrolase YbcI (DUF457 family)
MFIGHFGVAFATKRVAPMPSLGTLVLAAQWADGVWPIFLLLGWEKVVIAPGITAATPLDFVSYPYTHSLVWDVMWGALLGGVYFIRRRDATGALWIALLVVSHWLLDFISHRPDMPLWLGSTRYGLGLWYSLPASMIVETFLLAQGAWLYARATRACDGIGRWAWRSFVATLYLLYVASAIGPPPPDERTLAITSLAGWLFVVWAYWIDRHREVPPQTNPAVPRFKTA